MAAAVLRSAARRLPGSPLFHAAPPSGVLILRAPPSLPLFQPKPVAAELLHPIPAAGFLVQRAPASRVDALRGPFLPRMMSTQSHPPQPEYIVVGKARYEQLLKVVREKQDLDVRDNLMDNSFRLLASKRAILPIKLGRWDRFLFAAQVYFIPTTTADLRKLIRKVYFAVFVSSLVIYKAKDLTNHELIIAYTNFAVYMYPMLVLFFIIGG